MGVVEQQKGRATLEGNLSRGERQGRKAAVALELVHHGVGE